MLRIRLVIWYSLLVLLTVGASGAVLYFLLYRSLTSELDTTLTIDARTTLRLISGTSQRTPDTASATSPTKKVYRSKTIRQLLDEALEDAPEDVSGDELTDRVFSSITDEILFELSDERNSTAQIEALLRRTLGTKYSYHTEVYRLTSSNTLQLLYRSDNLVSDTLRSLYGLDSITREDSSRLLGEKTLGSENLRGAVASNGRFVVVIAYPDTEVKETTARLVSSFLYIIPIALVIATIGGVILARKALKPIEDIADTAREISVKNLSQRIEMPSRSDRELTQLVSTLNSMIARLQVSYDQVAQFSSDASHELKTPLAIMKGEIEQAQRMQSGSGELLQSMMEEVERMQRIVEGLLLIAKAEDNRLPLDKEETNMYAFLDAISEDAEILAADRGLSFAKELEEASRETLISIDQTKFYQVLMNLVDNALKYTPQGGMVTMFLHPADGGIEFGVADTGPGIPEDDLEKVFHRFYRTEQARSHSGAEYAARSLGLGLSITKSIVEAHQGRISVTSTLGKGTTFTVFLPVSAS